VLPSLFGEMSKGLTGFNESTAESYIIVPHKGRDIPESLDRTYKHVLMSMNKVTEFTLVAIRDVE